MEVDHAMEVAHAMEFARATEVFLAMRVTLMASIRAIQAVRPTEAAGLFQDAMVMQAVHLEQVAHLNQAICPMYATRLLEAVTVILVAALALSTAAPVPPVYASTTNSAGVVFRVHVTVAFDNGQAAAFRITYVGLQKVIVQSTTDDRTISIVDVELLVLLSQGLG